MIPLQLRDGPPCPKIGRNCPKSHSCLAHRPAHSSTLPQCLGLVGTLQTKNKVSTGPRKQSLLKVANKLLGFLANFEKGQDRTWEHVSIAGRNALGITNWRCPGSLSPNLGGHQSWGHLLTSHKPASKSTPSADPRRAHHRRMGKVCWGRLMCLHSLLLANTSSSGYS